MERTIRVQEGPLTFKHLLLVGLALATAKSPGKLPPPPAAQPLATPGDEAAAPIAASRAWRDVLLRSWQEATDDNIGLAAAGVAFYAFLALVPLLGAVVLTYGLFASPASVGEDFAKLTQVLPRDAAQLIGDQMAQVVQTSGSKKGVGLLIALAIALFGARSAVGGVITSLNIAYEEKEKRGLLKVNLLAFGMTAAAAALAALAVGAVSALGYLDVALPHVGAVITGMLKVVSYILLVLVAAAAAATLYRYGPSHQNARWRWITPGTVIFAVAWVALTAGLGFYAANFGHYGATYGSLAGAILLLTWIWLSAYALLFGAELNSELEQRTAPRAKGTRK